MAKQFRDNLPYWGLIPSAEVYLRDSGGGNEEFAGPHFMGDKSSSFERNVTGGKRGREKRGHPREGLRVRQGQQDPKRGLNFLRFHLHLSTHLFDQSCYRVEPPATRIP